MAAIHNMLVASGGGRVSAAVVISSNTQNYVLNTAKATGYIAEATDFVLTINSGIYVGSSSTGGIALDVDTSWAAGDTVTIINNGFITGCGGGGGAGGGLPSVFTGSPGGVGGAALRAQRPTLINNASGTIGGGGGGGGGGGAGTDAGANAGGGGGGGGGRGYSGGGGGAGGVKAGSAGNGWPGNAGSESAFGSGGAGGFTTGGVPGGDGGSGGGLGASGGAGGFGAFGGGAGASGGNCTATGSNANITWISTGTRLGTLG